MIQFYKFFKLTHVGKAYSMLIKGGPWGVRVTDANIIVR